MSEQVKCGRGHESARSMWNCPVCTDHHTDSVHILKRALERARSGIANKKIWKSEYGESYAVQEVKGIDEALLSVKQLEDGDLKPIAFKKKWVAIEVEGLIQKCDEGDVSGDERDTILDDLLRVCIKHGCSFGGSFNMIEDGR